MDRLRQMQVFTLVAQHLSLVQAARDLDISPAAVSKQLSRLEEDVGAVLLERSTRSVKLTPTGERYLQQCERVLSEADEANRIITREKEAPHGHIRIVSGRHFANRYIVPNLTRFFSEYPNLKVDLEISERIPDLETEGVDVLIGHTTEAPVNCYQEQIMSTRLLFCASKDYLKKHGTPASPDDLINHRYIKHTMRRPSHAVPLKGGKLCPVQPYMLISDVGAIVELVAQGMGIAMVGHAWAADLLKTGKIVEILQDSLEPEMPVFAAFPPRRTRPAAVRAFMDFITDICKGDKLG